ncbi:hypothetical protein CROQUDRAFT_653825 [Cronartium quercuum f. sp. fusiforme G11]|uniref:Uncharacterized protein n=1 Tax=Cronartium quercuum f. sp. fusiforme G11 TaxID=708437 RepID=A0A9P6NTM1_9BASI|nr:hypothetical protein CROQUDRAFT_653825 [Cronartium quercuum f. sp. fusiforme G11]
MNSERARRSTRDRTEKRLFVLLYLADLLPDFFCAFLAGVSCMLVLVIKFEDGSVRGSEVEQ